MTRDEIITKVAAALEPLEYVRALWLEGADALGRVDRYSDIDFNADVLDGYEDALFAAMDALFEYDAADTTRRDSEQSQRVYHISGTDEYLALDFNAIPHRHGGRFSTFVRAPAFDSVNELVFAGYSAEGLPGAEIRVEHVARYDADTRALARMLYDDRHGDLRVVERRKRNKHAGRGAAARLRGAGF